MQFNIFVVNTCGSKSCCDWAHNGKDGGGILASSTPRVGCHSASAPGFRWGNGQRTALARRAVGLSLPRVSF